MNELKVLNNEVATLESREVAEMVGKEHSKLMRDIRQYVEYLAEANFGLGDFFIESSYFDGNNQERPCYLLTKKGCELVGNKMIGAKGVQFTAMYVQKFNEMEQQQPKLEGLSPQLQLLISMEMKQKELEDKVNATDHKLESIKEVVALSHTDWRTDSKNLISKIALKLGGYEHITDIRSDSYKMLNERLGVDVHTRVTNKRRRMAEEGVCKSKRDKINPLDVIAEDKKLINGYVLIIKELAIKYGMDLYEEE